MNETANGSGLTVQDTGIHLGGCSFSKNKGDGICIKSITRRPADLQIEARNFLKKHPMSIVITDSEVAHNSRNGISFNGFWKGPIEVSDCTIVDNAQYGLSMQGHVSLDEIERTHLQRLEPEYNNKKKEAAKKKEEEEKKEKEKGCLAPVA